MSGMGLDALPKVRGVWRPTGGLRGIRRPSWSSERGQEALLEIREGLGGPSRGLGGF